MSFALLSPALVEALHDTALNPGELPGRAGDKSLESTLARVENHLVYGMVEDVFALAALYAEAISRGHCFNDGNKRTAFEAMNFCLDANGVYLSWPDPEDIGDRIIALARGESDHAALAEHLRSQAGR